MNQPETQVFENTAHLTASVDALPAALSPSSIPAADRVKYSDKLWRKCVQKIEIAKKYKKHAVANPNPRQFKVIKVLSESRNEPYLDQTGWVIDSDVVGSKDGEQKVHWLRFTDGRKFAFLEKDLQEIIPEQSKAVKVVKTSLKVSLGVLTGIGVALVLKNLISARKKAKVE